MWDTGDGDLSGAFQQADRCIEGSRMFAESLILTERKQRQGPRLLSTSVLLTTDPS